MKILLQILLVLFSAGNCMAGTPYLVKDICSPSKTTDCYLHESGPYRGLQEFTPVDDILFFSADDGIHGRELWKSDGTSKGTVMVKNINSQYETPSSWSSTPLDLINVNGTLFFTAWDGVHGRELWKSDGTAGGTVLIRNTNHDDTDWASYSGNEHINSLITFNGSLYYRSGTPDTGMAIWKSDGTSAGTYKISDNVLVGELLSTEQALYFIVKNPLLRLYTQLWKMDWNQNSEVLIRDFGEQYDGIGFKYYADKTNGFFYLSAGGLGWSELWKSDGNAAGTIRVKNFNFGLKGNDAPTNIGETLFFTGITNTDDSNAVALWRSDGSDSGTFVIEDSFPCRDPDGPDHLTPIGDTLFFTACDESQGENYRFEGYNLWKTDGTPQSATRVKVFVRNIFRGDAPEEMVNIKGTLFFPARTLSGKGEELWMSDGTNRGTVQVADINPGRSASDPKNLTNVDGTLFFTAFDGVHGRELWAFKSESKGDCSFSWSTFLPAILRATK